MDEDGAYRFGSLDARFPLSGAIHDTDDEVLELREEVDRLRAALVAERAERKAAYDVAYAPREVDDGDRAEARAELVAEGLLPPG